MKHFAIAVLMTLGLGLAALPAHAAAPAKDVLGRSIPVGSGRPALVFYTNRHTRELMQKNAFEQVYALRDVEPIVVVHVDLRDVPGMLQGMARREVKKAHRDSIAEMRKVFAKHGQEIPDDAALDGSLFMIAEPEGELNAAKGLEEDASTVVAEAVDAKGKTVATGAYPEQKDKLSRALGGGEDGWARR